MTIATLLIGISLGLDLFAGGLSVGVAGLPRERWAKTALLFACFGVALLALGLLIGHLLSDGLGNIASYLAGVALIALGAVALLNTFRDGHDADEPIRIDPRSVATTGLVASFDKLAVGVSLSLLDASTTLALVYFGVQGFLLTFLGLALGKRLGTRLGFVAHLVTGAVFLVLGAAVIVKTAR